MCPYILPLYQHILVSASFDWHYLEVIRCASSVSFCGAVEGYITLDLHPLHSSGLYHSAHSLSFTLQFTHCIHATMSLRSMFNRSKVLTYAAHDRDTASDVFGLIVDAYKNLHSDSEFARLSLTLEEYGKRLKKGFMEEIPSDTGIPLSLSKTLGDLYQFTKPIIKAAALDSTTLDVSEGLAAQQAVALLDGMARGTHNYKDTLV